MASYYYGLLTKGNEFINHAIQQYDTRMCTRRINKNILGSLT